jgi:predicted ATP-dependent serine protease
MGKNIGIMAMLQKQYHSTDLPEEWEAALGQISDPFRWLVFGLPKNGKTTFLLKFCQAMSLRNKVYYNSSEEGDSKTLQQAIIRAGFTEANSGKFILGDRDTFSEMIEKLRKNKAKIVVIDSRDYLKLTTDQYKKLTTMFPKKSFIIVCWEQSGKPLGKYAKDIEFMVDMVTHVSDHIATTNGRFGAELKYDVWKEKPTRKRRLGGQLTLI